ncbi:MAG TPA: glycosyltransferase 87 family protein [Polyangia bacterium]
MSRRLRGGALAFAIAMYLAWISAGPLPLQQAKEGALAPTDFTRDFIAAKVLLRGEPISQLDGARGNAEAVAAGARPVHIIDGGPFHLHPPAAALPILPLVPLGYRGASAVWQALSLLLLARLAWLLARLRPGRWPSPLLWLVLLLSWPPVLTNIELGQWSILLATMVAEAHRAHEEGRSGRAGAWLGAAAAMKLTPLVFLGFLLGFLLGSPVGSPAPRRRRAPLAFAGALLLACLIAFPFGRLDPWVAFFRDAGKNTAGWQTFWHNTLSLNGLFARALVGGPFATPFVAAPRLARALLLAASAGLIGAAFLLGRPRRREPGPGGPAVEGCRFALWAVLAVVLNPLAWAHTAVILVLPAVLVLRAADDDALAPRARRRVRALVAAALVALTVPKETLYLLVEPLPSPPLRGLLLSLHLGGALALLAAAALASRSILRSWAIQKSRS